MSTVQVTESTIPFTYQGETYQTWYKLVGELFSATRPPLIVLHGGPGMGHNYMTSIADLASSIPARPVVFYDQIGCGKSTHLPSKPPEFWSVELFVAELENILAYLKINVFDLLGHSWGGVVASEYVVRRQPEGLRHLILSNSLANSKIRTRARRRLMLQLPEDVHRPILKHEDSEGHVRAKDYNHAMKIYLKTHFCTMDPPPQELLTSVAVNNDKNGGGCVNTHVNVYLRNDWDITDRLHLITVPTLIINGKDDFMTDEVQAPFLQGIRSSRWVKFMKSSHCPHLEEREKYMHVVGEFLES